MAVEKRQYDTSFKQEALRLLGMSGKSVRQIEDELGITPGLLNKWKKRYQLHPTTGEVKPSQELDLEAENRRLRRELELVKAERDLLKKRSSCLHRMCHEISSDPNRTRGIVIGSRLPGAEGIGERVLCVAAADAPPRLPKAEDGLTAQIHAVFAESGGTYGSPRVTAALRQQGIMCNHKRVARLMRAQGLVAKCRRRRVRTTDSQHPYPVAPNLLQRAFCAQRPNEKWVGEMDCSQMTNSA
ncbi:MAG: IS3 family transposase [Anaerolineae bacterium]|nr:IS3 family transposase [Anaerolineae bacterium]